MVCQVFVRLPTGEQLTTLELKSDSCVGDLFGAVSEILSFSKHSEFYVLRNGSVLHSDDGVHNNETFDLRCRLRGGKGGFGSMLRAIGAQIEKTTNREACRDLSGRRLRAINDEKRIRHYARIKAQKEMEREEKRKKKLESLATSKPHHEFDDAQYMKDREEIPQNVEEAVEKAFAEAPPGPSGIKRPAEKPAKAPEPKKIKGWMGDLEGFEDSDESDSDEIKSDSASASSASGSKSS